MHIEQIESDMYLFAASPMSHWLLLFCTVDARYSLITLPDAHDAQIMHPHTEDQMGTQVDLFVMTNYMNDHIAELHFLEAYRGAGNVCTHICRK